MCREKLSGHISFSHIDTICYWIKRWIKLQTCCNDAFPRHHFDHGLDELCTSIAHPLQFAHILRLCARHILSVTPCECKFELISHINMWQTHNKYAQIGIYSFEQKWNLLHLGFQTFRGLCAVCGRDLGIYSLSRVPVNKPLQHPRQRQNPRVVICQ